jgi:hypothetical protein
MLPSNTSVDPTPPKVLFTGRVINYKVDVRIGFGEYVEIDAMENFRNDAIKSRTLSAISLDPSGNLQGSVKFFVLTKPEIIPGTEGTKKEKLSYGFMTRDRWVKMEMSQEIIDRMNAITHDNKTIYPPIDLMNLDGDLQQRNAMLDLEAARREVREPNWGISGEGHISVENVPDILPEIQEEEINDSRPLQSQPLEYGDPTPPLTSEGVNEELVSPSPVEDIVNDELPGVMTTSDGGVVVEDVDEDEIAEPAPELDTGQSSVGEPPPLRVSTRATKGLRPQRYTYEEYKNLIIYRISFSKGLQKYGVSAVEAATKELKQMINQGVWSKVHKKDLAKINWEMVIYSFMFLKEKFKPDGTFDKLKMRLVGGGDKQNKLDYDDISSPTVSLTTVFIVLVISIRKRYRIVTTDIAGAYLNARLKNKNLHMKIDATLASILCEIDSSYKDYLLKDGSLIVKLERALYGCIESAKLWYELLAKTLMEYGLVRSNYDPCLFYDLEREIYATIYVDDILIAAREDAEVRKLLKYLEDKFKTITVDEGEVISYLGMNIHLDYEREQVKITMDKYIEDVLEVCDVVGNAKTPALSDLFTVDVNSPPLAQDEKEHFHSMVAKLLYLAKRVRPDILTAISFLATRVKEPNVQDAIKLGRVCRYIRSTKEKCIVLKSNGDVVAYVDASHAVHSKDGRSHTGVYITLGEGPIFVRSTKQKLTTKSSTEAELVALSDALTMIIWVRELLIEIGYMKGDQAVKIMEDNQSTIALVKRGTPSGESTRHINIRYFFITDRVRNKEVIIIYCPTNLMLADYFTKPLVGSLHHDMASLMMNDYGNTKPPVIMSESPGVFDK